MNNHLDEAIPGHKMMLGRAAALLLAVIVPCSLAARWATLTGLAGSFPSKHLWGGIGRRHKYRHASSSLVALRVRCGASVPHVTDAPVDGKQKEEEEISLDDKVQAAMKRLGIDPPGGGAVGAPEDAKCEKGVCKLSVADVVPVEEEEGEEQDADALAEKIALEMKVDKNIAMAAIGATAQTGDSEAGFKLNEDAARAMIQYELDAIGAVSQDSDEVKQLVSEGHDPLLTRRALAFAEMNVEDARAILVADEEDEQAERAAAEEAETRAQLRAEAEAKKKTEAEAKAAAPPMKTVTVDANFDPTNPGSAAAPELPGLSSRAPKLGSPPPPAKKEDVVFEATTSEIQKLVLESPVPVLLDVYADWCGPCKALTPALEQMAVKAGGMFRLVKVNSDNDRPVSGALEVTALPTVFGIRDGRIVNVFKGMPRDETFMQNFMMGLLTPGGKFTEPVVTKEDEKKFEELSAKLVKVAAASGLPFSQRERLQDRTSSRLDELVECCRGNMADAEDSARTLRSLLSNVIRDPWESKFRKINLENKIVEARVAKYPPCISILKSVGFVLGDGGKTMVVGTGKKVANVAPFVVVRESIDKWIDRNRQALAAAARKRKDEIERARLATEAAARGDESDDYDEYDEEDEIDPSACLIKMRLEGKKKVHELTLHANDSLNKIIEHLPQKVVEGEVVRITCAARRLVVTSMDKDAMGKTLREHGLHPAASIVVKVGDGEATAEGGGLAERAAAKRENKKKTGSHTMQSVGIYSKDDNAKGELIDGGGGVWYEHDVTSDEEEEDGGDKQEEGNEESSDDADDKEGIVDGESEHNA